ncbi:SDR family NAD(P)-dependent oxidoreductase [Gordonia liuliyuniae]|uniref:SDR family oxidoreductase n=1 Tax=Gordonia liuliyuniae TaxID=2911517 RepID=A0ABS9ITP5_9ACTN|nr:SDR family NAD(P)-dependent oxidoreductase [Gordonia liuliyuniae]MCF8588928.1 SDR family oxidoreductase [Gordonia liuliyuniae]
MQGRRILVTGGAGGIGAAAVKQMSDEGAAVAVLDRDLDAARRLAADIDGATAFECDVTDAASVDAAVAAAANELGGLDGVLTCAGIARSGLPHEMSLDDWHAVIDVNLNGTFLAIRAAMPHLLAADVASVVTIGSVASLVAANTNTCGYDASKSGVVGLTRSVAAGYAEHGVRANCLCPGVVDTPLARRAREVEGVTSNAVAATPLGRRAEPEEMARIIAFLLSSEASYMTGSVVTADGGLTAR